MKIKHNFKIEAKPEMVYAALISPHGLQSWFCKKGSIESEVGGVHVFSYLKEGQPKTIEMKIEVLELNKKVVWRCVKHELDIWINTSLSFEIKDDGTFEFIHSGFKQENCDIERYGLVSKAWDYFMKNLKDFCETGDAHPW